MTITQIRKRDGRLVPFDEEKIASAIDKALEATGRPDRGHASELAQEVRVLLEVEGAEVPEVEHVQDLVERVLMDGGYVQTARAYILYRERRTRSREMNVRLMRLYEDAAFSSARDSDRQRENANIDGDTAMAAMLRFGSEGAREFGAMFVLDPDFARAHREGDIHIHDLEYLTLTAASCQIDIVKLFRGGFSTGHGVLREPNGVLSCAALCALAIQGAQNDQHGGQSIPNFDYGMAIGVKRTFVKKYRRNASRALELIEGAEEADSRMKKLVSSVEIASGLCPCLEGNGDYEAAEKPLLMAEFSLAGDEADRVQQFARMRAERETEEETRQAMERLLADLNTMVSRGGAQTPFSALNYGTDATPEGRMVVKNLLLATEAGLGNGKTPIFPIQIFRVKEGVNCLPGDPNYDLYRLAIRCSARRLFPNFSFQDAPFNLESYVPGRPESEISYTGCRTRVCGNRHDPDHPGCAGRGNLFAVTVNLPRLALRAGGDREKFWQALDGETELCIRQLTERLEILSRKKAKNYPFLMGQGVWLGSGKLAPEDEVREVLKNGTLSVGFVGLAETLTALTGAHHGQSGEAQELGLAIVGRMRELTERAAGDSGLNFTLLASPAEGASGRLVKLDAARFGVIPGVTDKLYYTNSFHIPAGFPIPAREKISLEAPYHALTDGGHVSYVELAGDPSQRLDEMESLLECMRKSGMGYGGIDHPADYDPVCGYSGVIGARCPRCGRAEDDVPFQRVLRVADYLAEDAGRLSDAQRSEADDRAAARWEESL